MKRIAYEEKIELNLKLEAPTACIYGLSAPVFKHKHK